MSGIRKFFLNDLGYKNFLYSGFKHGFGYMLENLIYLDLKRNGFEVYVGTQRNKEIDFIALKNDMPLYVQVSYNLEEETTRKREYTALLTIKDNYPKIVVSLDDMQLPDYEGIKHILAWELENFLFSLFN
jgi:hypothetical protein